MERFFIAMADRQRDAGREAGSFFAYRLIHDFAFLDEMDALLAEAQKQAETDIAKTRVSYAMIQPRRLRMFLNMHGKMSSFDFVGAQREYERMLEAHAADEQRNRQFASAMGARFLGTYANRFLTGSIKYSSEPYRVLYRIPERLKTAFDRKVMGQHMRFFGREINDSLYIETSTYSATWDAQGLDGYRKGAVWYRIPFRLEGLPATEPDGQKTPVGLFIGGGEGVLNIWCNDRFVARSHAYVTTPQVIDLTDHVEIGADNLVALQFNRVGNDELGTGGLMFPSFIFTGPRVEMKDPADHQPFRVIPGGIIEYRE